jgi:hypothetical protein
VIERLAIAVMVVAAVAALGWYVRQVVRARSQRLSAGVTLPPTSAETRLLVFSTRYCAECDTQRRLIEESKETWSNSVDVSYHDAVAESDFARRFGILTVPALVVARADGRIVGVEQGLVLSDRLRSLIETAA